MRIAVASDVPLGSLRAHAINVIKTAGGFARLGHDVRLLLRAPSTAAYAVGLPSLAAVYGEPDLSVDLAPALPPHLIEVHSESRQRQFAAWAAARAARFSADAVFARHFEAALACASAGFPTIAETHAYAGDRNPALLRTLQASQDAALRLPIVTINPALRDSYVAQGAEARRVHVVPDGVDVEMFRPPPQLPPCPFERCSAASAHAVYAGHLYDYKGIPTILAGAQLLPDVLFHLVGGMPEDIARARETIATNGLTNVHLHGLQPYAQVPKWLWHADMLLLPPSADEPSAAWTSPVKLGEYLAAGAPIVASRIPGLQTWIQEPAVRWFAPDDARCLAAAIRSVLAETPAQAEARRVAARHSAEEFSYANRARKILAALASAGCGMPAGALAS